jgi:hypothetical protein
MLRLLSTVVSLWVVCCTSALADDQAAKRISDAALQEARGILAHELLGHYDVAALAVQSVEDPPGRSSLGHDYGLVKIILTFSTARNATKHPQLNRDMFEPGSAMCQGWLYLHCGVPMGHVFDGRLELLLALDGDGSWRAVSPRWRSRSAYSLHGYLLLDGREKEGYVLFPKR